MIFYSNNFIFDGVSGEELNMHLVSEEDGILNEYGISYDKDLDEIVLSFCYSDDYGKALIWDEGIVSEVFNWFITDEFKPFISEDNPDIIYYLKGYKMSKRFSNDFKGILDVTFKILSPYGYRKYIKEVEDVSSSFDVLNYSNISPTFKPVIEIENISGDSVVIKNNTTGAESFIIENLNEGQFIIIDNHMGTIFDLDGNNLIKNSNRKWMSLVKGVNNLTVNGDCKITIKALYPVVV